MTIVRLVTSQREVAKLIPRIALVVVYEYYPNAQTLYEAHLKPKLPHYQNGHLQGQNTRLPERKIWSYVIQIASAIRAIHESGLAARVIDSSKILVTGEKRYVSAI